MSLSTSQDALYTCQQRLGLDNCTLAIGVVLTAEQEQETNSGKIPGISKGGAWYD